MLQEEHIRKEVRNKISSNTIMSGWSKQQSIAYFLYENQKEYDKKYADISLKKIILVEVMTNMNMKVWMDWSHRAGMLI